MGRARVVLTLALALSPLPPATPLQGQSIREVFDRVSHAVVIVYTSQTQYELRSSGITAVDVGGIGSGVLIGPTRILTAAHVVQAANEVVVEFPDGEVMRALCWPHGRLMTWHFSNWRARLRWLRWRSAIQMPWPSVTRFSWSGPRWVRPLRLRSAT